MSISQPRTLAGGDLTAAVEWQAARRRAARQQALLHLRAAYIELTDVLAFGDTPPVTADEVRAVSQQLENTLAAAPAPIELTRREAAALLERYRAALVESLLSA